MNYLNIITDCISDGPGFRVSLYVSGCKNHCKGCHNPESWNHQAGSEFTRKTLDNLLDYLNHDYIQGLTLCGGEPCDPDNIKTVTEIVMIVKQHLPKKNIWMYTGYTWEELTKRLDAKELLQLVDVAVVGRFEIDKRDISDNNRWRGSTNQRVVDVKNSLKKKREVFVGGIPNNN